MTKRELFLHMAHQMFRPWEAGIASAALLTWPIGAAMLVADWIAIRVFRIK